MLNYLKGFQFEIFNCEVGGVFLKSFEDKLVSYAKLAVQVGVNIQPGQILYVSAEINTAQFTRIVVKEAYLAGAKNVVVDYYDDANSRMKYELAPDEVFNEYPEWERIKREMLCEQDAAFLSIISQNPDLLNGIEPSRIANSQKASGKALIKWREYLQADKNSWSIVAIPSPEWAAKVFPDDNKCVEKLWDAIFSACRIDQDNPVVAWKKHNENLHTKVDYLNNKKYRKLHYKSNGTDLVVGLHPTHLWAGAASTNRFGTEFMANMPTEEVFTAPARNDINGTVLSTKPLSYAGNIIDNFSLTFENGRIVDVAAVQGEEVLKNLVATDEGSHYLGEVALVPFDSPISNTNILFYNTLFDENASNHFAIGNGYAFSVEGGKEMSKAELAAVEVNESIVHVDFMVGSADMDIDGILEDGTSEPIFRNGNWAF